MTIAQFAARFGQPIETVRQWLHQGMIPGAEKRAPELLPNQEVWVIPDDAVPPSQPRTSTGARLGRPRGNPQEFDAVGRTKPAKKKAPKKSQPRIPVPAGREAPRPAAPMSGTKTK